LLARGSHLSWHTVTDMLQPPPREQPGRPNVPVTTVLLRIEFTGTDTSMPFSGLLPHFSTLTSNSVVTRFGRYISVALVLKSPSAGVTRYPCPVQPGLSSLPDLSLRECDCPVYSPEAVYYKRLFMSTQIKGISLEIYGLRPQPLNNLIAQNALIGL
jgi:hypothetical protein